MELTENVEKLTKLQEDLLRSIRGSWDNEGIVSKHNALDVRVTSMEASKDKMKNFTAGAAFAISSISGIVGALLSLLGYYLMFKK